MSSWKTQIYLKKYSWLVFFGTEQLKISEKVIGRFNLEIIIYTFVIYSSITKDVFPELKSLGKEWKKDAE